MDPSHRVLGREGETVEVFIPLKGSPVAIYCLTPELSRKTISNPMTHWWREGKSQAHVIGEGDQYRVRLDGSLMLLNWETSQATGFYYCTMKHIRGQKEYSLTLQFCLVAYHIPFRSLQVNVQLKTTTCEKHFVENSVKFLESVLSSMCRQLSCVITSTTFNCTQWGTLAGTVEHHIQLKIPVQSQGEDIIMPCKTGQECHNEETLRKAFQKIHTFLTQSKFVLDTSNDVPPLYYVEGSFKAMKVDHCLAGMGKLLGRNRPCVDCCVTCGPGSYSPNGTSICIPCPNNFYQHRFGRTQCMACPLGLKTNGEGAISSTDCHNARIQERMLDFKSEKSRVNDSTAPKDERHNSTHFMITIVVCSLAFLGTTALTIYCLVTFLCKDKDATANQPALRVKETENANLKNIRSSTHHMPMKADQNRGTWFK
ncbi:zona pellucida-binding protein 1-like isoform X2 [Leucoraja erinacea]|uniref:zona pellucida-binding protein 1-like isoform X2 n=1 Tax=Leucoraja erinaceus TaxID=7782 RepID=UPI0024579B00|nr:zona pellucida-binding protein 1-like isoform X2 [Leucoraja erinacea]